MRVEDVQYVLDELGGGNYARSGDHLMSSCPLAPWTHSSGEDSNPSFGVLITEGMAPCNCFNPECFPTNGRSGTLLNLVQEIGAWKIKDGEWTSKEVDDLISFVMLAEDEEVDDDWGEEVQILPIPPEIVEALGTGSPYWRGRGVGEETEREWRLGEAGHRALIPVLNRRAEVVAVQGRLVDGHEEDEYAFDRLTGSKATTAKHRSWPVGFQRENHLAGEHLLKNPADVLIVVESPADAVLLNEWLRDREGWVAVSTLGGKVAEQQFQMIVEGVAPDGELVLGFDMDNPGRLARKKSVEALKRRVPRISVVSWERQDPSDRGEDGKVSFNMLKKEGLKALDEREDWFERELRRKLRIGA